MQTTILLAILVVVVLFVHMKGMSAESLATLPVPAKAAPAAGGARTVGAGGTIYPAVSHASGINVAGTNQQITYASSGKAATSHRSDVQGVSQPNLEATVYLAWPANCTGGGHPELAIKFWGPNHTDASCCYCYTSAVPNGGQLQLGFGGEGPHPSTTTLQKVATTIPFTPGKVYGIKGMIWKRANGQIHQETWYDDGSGFKLAGTNERATCGKDKTSTAPAAGAEVEFRVDCANITFSKTDVAVITPPASAAFAESGPSRGGWITPVSKSEGPIQTPQDIDSCGCADGDPTCDQTHPDYQDSELAPPISLYGSVSNS